MRNEAKDLYTVFQRPPNIALQSILLIERKVYYSYSIIPIRELFLEDVILLNTETTTYYLALFQTLNNNWQMINLALDAFFIGHLQNISHKQK
jgi:hypothetical protein